MNRGWLVYILMFVLAVGGLSIILTLGHAAEAPDDLSGEWLVRWDSQPPPAPPMSRGNSMRIDQSGRFFTIRFPDTKPMSFTLQPGWKGSRDGRRLDMSLRGEVWTIRLSAEFRKLDPPIIDEIRMNLAGPSNHAAIARRPDAPATRPAAGIAHAR
jgi:hypothetical protein